VLSVFAFCLSKSSGQKLIQKHLQGFSLQNIIDLDANRYHAFSPERDSLFDKYRFGRELTYDLTKWTGAQIYFRQNTNHVFQLNLKKDIFERDFSQNEEADDDHVRNVEAYIKNSNHPTSKTDVTLSWVRFTIIKPGQYENVFGDLKETVVVLDEVQTDLDDEQFFGKELMEGWEQATMRYFMRFVRQSLKVRKIYMPTYQAKQDLYNANPPMYLYKELPFKVGFKKNSGVENFLLAEKTLNPR
jgi:RNAse (barnase) inhibitor barstar